MADRAYTVREIEDMRCAIHTLIKFGRHWHFRQRGVITHLEIDPRDVEERLRTYMLHGTTPDELNVEADAVRAEYEAFKKASEAGLKTRLNING